MAAVALVRSSGSRLSSRDLETRLMQHLQISRRKAKQLIRQSVSMNELSYTYQFGHSFLEPSFRRPVALGRRVVIKPPQTTFQARPNQVVIDLEPGAAFGSGEHPSTRLAVEAVEFAVSNMIPSTLSAGSTVLDVGTGSGILLIAALRLGIRSGLGLDIDPCARWEAWHNACLNGLQKRIQIRNRELKSICSKFLLITANLRFPTLASCASEFNRLSFPGGRLILAGFTKGETADLLNGYQKIGFGPIWRQSEGKWAAVVLKNE